MHSRTLSQMTTGLFCWVLLAGALNVIADSQNAFELNYHPPRFHAALSLITNPEKPIRDRVNTVQHLSKNLSVLEIQGLYAFLKARPAKGENLPALHYLKNEILSVLRNQSVAPAGLTGLMIALSEDPGQDMVIRDYALQHLAIWCEEGVGGDIADQRRIRKTLVQLAQQPTVLAGTALLGLQRLSAYETEAESEDVNHLALQMAQDKKMPNAARVTAIGVCGERKVPEALSTIQAVAENHGYAVGLRISAIGALGQMGGPQSLDTLRWLRGSEKDRALKGAVAAALKRLEPEVVSRGPL